MELQKVDEFNFDLINDPEIEFYNQKLKEAKSKVYSKYKKKNRNKNFKILDQTINSKAAVYHADTVEVMREIPNDSIHYSIFSPPFASLFTYSDSKRDMGNSSDIEFYTHFSYLTKELYRTLKPGRLISIHCMDIPAMKSKEGYIGLKEFPDLILSAFKKEGFIYHSKVQIKKNELFEAQRTKAIGLAHKQVVKDSAICRNALPDYIITIRKPGENDEPISRPNGFEEYIGSLDQPKKEKHKIQAKNKFSQKIWQRYASSVWLDIRQTNTLNAKAARESKDERHICPLQLDTIARCLELWTNPGDVVLDPFCGIGSTGYVALDMKRKFIGIELKEVYYKQSVKNLNIAKNRKARLKSFF